MRCLLLGMQGTAPTLLWKKGREGVALKRFSHFNSFCMYFCSKGNIFATVTQSGIEA